MAPNVVVAAIVAARVALAPKPKEKFHVLLAVVVVVSYCKKRGSKEQKQLQQ